MTGNEIKQLRKDLGGISQEALARKIGCSQASVYNWERGTYQPTQMALAALEKLKEEASDARQGS